MVEALGVGSRSSIFLRDWPRGYDPLVVFVETLTLEAQNQPPLPLARRSSRARGYPVLSKIPEVPGWP